jgi:hypothetical protein
MKIKLLALLMFFGGIAWAGQEQSSPKPGMFASQTSTMEAVVEAIDHEARLVTLKRADGTSVTFTPGPDVRNLDQVNVGDMLHVEYSQTVRILVADAGDIDPAAGAVSAMTRSEEGEMPAMAAVDTKVILAKVVAIDLDNMTYKLEFPDGSVNEYVAMVEENLKMAAVGDTVAIEVTESVIAAVEDLTP